MTDTSLQPYHLGHPKIQAALDQTSTMLWTLQDANVPNTVIVEAMLQEIVWMIDTLDATTAEATAMRGVISWFSEQCADLLVTPPSIASRLDRH
jgi:hypothetical protein